MSQARGKFNFLWRRIAEHFLDIILCRGVVAKLCFRLGLHGQLSKSYYHLQLKRDKALPNPLRIAFLSDFHAGPTTCAEIYELAFQEIKKAKVSVLLLGGDFISCRAKYIDHLLPLIEACEAPLGKFAVFGNHDLWADHTYIYEQLTQIGVKVLVNQNQTLATPFSMVSICGTDDPWTGEIDMQATLSNASDMRLLLTHAPDGIGFIDNEKFDIAFAGHTHGGQIASRKGRPLIRANGKLSQQYLHGLFKLGDDSSLIVSRGIGCSNFPVRINAAPELVICELS